MAPPVVSILVPIYRRREYLAEAIQSCLDQTRGDFEILVTEEAESDVAQEVLKQFSDPRIRYRRQSVRLGVGSNLQNAWNETASPLLCILNDDDRLASGFLEALVPPLLAEPSLACAFCDINIMDGNGVVDEVSSDRASTDWLRATLRPGVHKPFIETGIFRSFVPIAMGTVFRRSVTQGFQIESGPSYDYFLSCLATRDGSGVYYEPRRLSYWRRHANQETVNGKQRIADAGVFIAEHLLKDPLLENYRDELRRRAARARESRAALALRNGNTAGSRDDLRRAISLYPSLRARGALLASFLPVAAARVLARARSVSA
jgi:glycosyltransferase involved in cell wall biosynthesis